ncbi:hypothetical protein VTI74DRAFT_5549 [Chaetomium olivicolor]
MPTTGKGAWLIGCLVGGGEEGQRKAKGKKKGMEASRNIPCLDSAQKPLRPNLALGVVVKSQPGQSCSVRDSLCGQTCRVGTAGRGQEEVVFGRVGGEVGAESRREGVEVRGAVVLFVYTRRAVVSWCVERGRARGKRCVLKSNPSSTASPNGLRPGSIFATGLLVGGETQGVSCAPDAEGDLFAVLGLALIDVGFKGGCYKSRPGADWRIWVVSVLWGGALFLLVGENRGLVGEREEGIPVAARGRCSPPNVMLSRSRE